MTPAEVQAHQDREARRAAARAKWGDGAAVIEETDIPFFSPDEVVALVDAGRIAGVGPDKRLRR